MVKDGDQEELIELKGTVELFRELPHTVNKLEEDGSSLVVTVVAVTMTNPLVELVTE